MIGNLVGQAFTTGTNACFIGVQAGSNATGDSNTLIGNTAGLNITTGNNNVIIGNSTRMGSTSTNNAVLGNDSGSGVTGDNNVFIGKDTGRYYGALSSLTASTNNIFLGYRARGLGNSETNTIVIGFDQVGLGSNTTSIGNSSTTTAAIYGNLLLGTTTAAGYKLDVNGSLRNTTSAYFATTSGSVGIGTTSPKTYSTLTNSGQLVNLSNIAIDNGQSYRFNNYYNSGTATDRTISTGYAAGINLDTGNMLFKLSTSSIAADSDVTLTERMRITSSGSILINTTTAVPSSLLTLVSNTQGFLPPVMTTAQKNAITSPATGLVVFDSTLGKLCVYSGGWQTITSV